MAISAAEIINNIIEKSDKTRAAIAKETGFTLSNFKKILSGSGNMQIETLQKICDALGYRIVIEKKEYKPTTVRTNYRYTIDGKKLTNSEALDMWQELHTAKEAISDIMAKDGHKQQHVAELAGISQPQLSYILSSAKYYQKRDMQLETFIKIVSALNYRILLCKDHNYPFFPNQNADDIYEIKSALTTNSILAETIRSMSDDDIVKHFYQNSPQGYGTLKDLAVILKAWKTGQPLPNVIGEDSEPASEDTAQTAAPKDELPW